MGRVRYHQIVPPSIGIFDPLGAAPAALDEGEA